MLFEGSYTHKVSHEPTVALAEPYNDNILVAMASSPPVQSSWHKDSMKSTRSKKFSPKNKKDGLSYSTPQNSEPVSIQSH